MILAHRAHPIQLDRFVEVFRAAVYEAASPEMQDTTSERVRGKLESRIEPLLGLNPQDGRRAFARLDTDLKSSKAQRFEYFVVAHLFLLRNFDTSGVDSQSRLMAQLRGPIIPLEKSTSADWPWEWTSDGTWHLAKFRLPEGSIGPPPKSLMPLFTLFVDNLKVRANHGPPSRHPALRATQQNHLSNGTKRRP